jgi:hypothetical protein
MKKLLVPLLILCVLISSMPVFAGTVGDWKTNKPATVMQDQDKIFKKATKEIVGVTYKPVALLARQVVSGTNYVYLCYGTTVSKKRVSSWYILSANKNLNNKVSLNSIEKIDIEDIKTSVKPRTETSVGGYEILPVRKKPFTLPANARKAFIKATKSYSEYDLSPIALLGTQLVAGTNYRILCYGKGKTSDLFVVDIYQKPSGKSSITSCKAFDLEAYV